jgi:malate permease and related proteins
MLQTILFAVLPTAIVVALGYAWARAGRTIDRATLTPMVSDLGVPCLAFVTIARLDLPLSQLGGTAAAFVLVLGLTMAASALFLRVLGLSLRTYLPALTFPNAGNLGVPLSLSAFGPAGLTFAMITLTMFSITNNTVGRSIAAGGDEWKKGLFSPVLPAVLLGLLCAGFNVKPPSWLMDALSMVGAIAIPLMLIMLGASLATIKVNRIWRATMLALWRIGIGAAIGFGVATLFGFTGAQRGALILQSSMPVAVINYLFADLYKNDPDEIASLVVISTLLSAISVPLLLATILH